MESAAVDPSDAIPVDTSSDGVAEKDPDANMAEDEGNVEEEPKELRNLDGGDTGENSAPREAVTFNAVYNKKKYEITFDLDETIASLKKHLESIINVTSDMQKIMVKGLADNKKTLREVGITPTTKVLIVGSQVSDVLSVTQPAKGASAPEEKVCAAKESFFENKIHKKVISAGVPPDAMMGIKNSKDALPDTPLTGMLNKNLGKVRLTFKLELDQIWFGTKERTEKVNMSSIKTIVSEPIPGNEEYHVVGFQLGPTEASRYWVYWVPAQYVESIKRTVLGNWQYY
ncbi:unnamed protein product [Notodromas monacha]|uniref:Ubiquitin-like domain-containing protein n=1 Tax=Notodromas monacha TaxID=399045 RepID=A0A7R9BN32_9CRUS|nr:unnamed protein product [Notodromas monacha]CAG0918554.1 unnamed protein product [Notodromas monacha]